MIVLTIEADNGACLRKYFADGELSLVLNLAEHLTRVDSNGEPYFEEAKSMPYKIKSCFVSYQDESRS